MTATTDPRSCPECGRDLSRLPQPVARCPGCLCRDPLGPEGHRRRTIKALHALDGRIAAGVAGGLLALVWLTIRRGAWDWILLSVPAGLILFALLPRKQ